MTIFLSLYMWYAEGKDRCFTGVRIGNVVLQRLAAFPDPNFLGTLRGFFKKLPFISGKCIFKGVIQPQIIYSEKDTAL